MKKLLALALTLCLVLAAIPASAAELLSAADTYPLNSTKKITWYVQDGMEPHEAYANYTESPFHMGLIENLGVDIEFMFPTTGTDGGVFTNTLLADPDDLPEIMKGYFMDNANLYLEDGLIWDLTPYIQEYAPAYYAWLQTNPAYDRAMKTDNGQYYAFGFFREDGGWNDTYLGPVVRKDWLEECGLEIPTTIAEFENMIRVFNEKYGAKFSFAYSRFQSAGLQGSFGAYGTADVSYFVKDGKVGLGQAQPEYRTYMTWLNKLWDEGLMDQDVLTLDDTSIKAKIHNDQVGVAITSMGQVNLWNKEREADGKEAIWIGIPYPKDENGEISSVFGGFGIGTHTTVITKAADEETMKLCLQILDYAYTAEGFLYWNYGTEGVSWNWDESTGLPAFTALVNDDPASDPMRKYNGTTWYGSCIQATNLLYLKNSQIAIDADSAWFYCYPDDEEKNLQVTGGWKWPVGVTFTVDESDELDLIGGGIGTYVTEKFAAFLTGGLDITDDAVWEKYLADFEVYNLSRVLEIRQACYDRYAAR